MDYEKLWKGMKEDLERWARMGGVDRPLAFGDNGTSAAVWEEMQRREEQGYGR